MLAQLRDDPLAQPSLPVKRDGDRIAILLHDDTAFSLSARIVDPDSGSAVEALPDRLALSGQRSVTRYLAAEGATLHRWRLAGDRLLPAGTLALHSGMIVRCDDRVEAQHAAPGSGAALVALTATLQGRATDPIREYALEGGALLRTGTRDLDASRRRMLLRLLRETGHPRADAAFDAASRHPQYFLRWEAMREWLGHDACAALPRLREMAASDPARDVRCAATEMARRVEAKIAAEARCPA